MIYHYTSLQALKGILRESPSERGLCFWATRYDCFADEEEYRLGIEEIHSLLPKVEKKVLPDRQIASSFVWDDIKSNDMLPMPYVVSFTKRRDNKHMWEEYADHNQGVVLAIDETKIKYFRNTPHMIMLKECLYRGQMTEERLLKEIQDEYVFGALNMLSGPKKNFSFTLLKDNPQFFVSLLAYYLLGYVAPRIKRSGYGREEEIRLIFPSQSPTPEVLSQLYHLSGVTIGDVRTDDLKEMVLDERVRTRANGETVYYREIQMSSSALFRIYVKECAKESEVRALLDDRHFRHIKVKTIE